NMVTGRLKNKEKQEENYRPTAITVQPTVFVTQGALPRPLPDYLCYSIFTMLCCCLPLGTAALIYSVLVSESFIAARLKCLQEMCAPFLPYSAIFLVLSLVCI
uniref:Transmembrane protein 91 n=1 Tax=Esox lucius TaxID=8010 RepID=A0A3P8Z3A6_ESOLU